MTTLEEPSTWRHSAEEVIFTVALIFVESERLLGVWRAIQQYGDVVAKDEPLATGGDGDKDKAVQIALRGRRVRVDSNR